MLRRPPLRRAPLLLLCSVQFMLILDTTIVAVALPSIGADLGFGTDAELQYLISVYALTLGGFLVIGGRLADVVGRRRLFVVGLALFTAASAGCGLAPSGGALLAGRAVQGLGAALVSPATLALLATVYPEGPARDRALATWAATGGIAGASGLVVGGVLTDTLGWQAAFLINVPVGVAGLLAARKALPRSAPSGSLRTVDLPGALVLTAALALLVNGLDQGAQHGFGGPSGLSRLAGAGLLFAVFVALERRVRHPLVDRRAVGRPALIGANLTNLFANAAIGSQLFLTTLVLQRVYHLSAFETGLGIVPNSVLVIAGSAVGGRLVARYDTGSVAAAGVGLIGIGAVLLTGVSTPAGYLADVLPGFSLTGFGLGLAVVALTRSVTSHADTDQLALASGILTTSSQLGFAVGTAAIAAGALTAAVPVTGDYATGYLVNAVLCAAGTVTALTLIRGRGVRR